MSGADLGFVRHEEWVVGRGGEGSSPGEILGNGISNAQSQEQINARNVSFENNSQWQIKIINSVKIFCYDPTLNCSTSVSLETYLLYLSNMILIKCDSKRININLILTIFLSSPCQRFTLS